MSYYDDEASMERDIRDEEIIDAMLEGLTMDEIEALREDKEARDAQYEMMQASHYY